MDRTTEADECGICFDGLADPVPLRCCAQRVCKRCYVKILATKPNCPYCAARLPVPEAHREVNVADCEMPFCAGVLGLFCCLLTGMVTQGICWKGF